MKRFNKDEMKEAAKRKKEILPADTDDYNIWCVYNKSHIPRCL